jgi:hypothetical protein
MLNEVKHPVGFLFPLTKLIHSRNGQLQLDDG